MTEAPGEGFDFERSPLKDAYTLLGAKTPMQLQLAYDKADQDLMKNRAWDYNNPGLSINKVKQILEVTNPSELTEDEREWREEILWFWYHHAISCAIARYHDRAAAKMYAEKALSYKTEKNPNRITKLFQLLLDDKIADAEAWATTVHEDEKDAAEFLVSEYRAGKFPS